MDEELGKPENETDGVSTASSCLQQTTLGAETMLRHQQKKAIKESPMDEELGNRRTKRMVSPQLPSCLQQTTLGAEAC